MGGITENLENYFTVHCNIDCSLLTVFKSLQGRVGSGGQFPCKVDRSADGSTTSLRTERLEDVQ